MTTKNLTTQEKPVQES